MLEKATDGQAPDLTTTWAAFSGVLTQATIDAADWKKGEGATKKKVRGPRSVNVFNIDAFQGAVGDGAPDSDPARGVPAHRSQGQRAADAGRLRAPR